MEQLDTIPPAHAAEVGSRRWAMGGRPLAVPRGHQGSASSNLSGWAVLIAWIISIAAHVLLFAFLLLLVFPFTTDYRSAVPPAHTEIIGEIDAASLVPSELPELSREASAADVDDLRLVPTRSLTVASRLLELGTTKRPELSIIGVGVGGGDFSRYGLGVGGGGGPEFFGAGGASTRGAKRIVYVVDRSGSMLDTFDYVRQELKRSISALRRSQKFRVIFFNSDLPLEGPPGKLTSAIKAQKQRFFAFLDGIVPGGGTDPGPAMRRALANEPDLIYFLTDGQFDLSLVDKLDKWNKSRRTRIFTIAYLDRGGADLLERIARQHNGEFKFVSEDDLP